MEGIFGTFLYFKGKEFLCPHFYLRGFPLFKKEDIRYLYKRFAVGGRGICEGDFQISVLCRRRNLFFFIFDVVTGTIADSYRIVV